MNASGFASYSSRSLPFGDFCVRRIREDAAAEQVAMEVGDERADVARAERLVVALEPLYCAHDAAHVVVPQLLVRIVDREIARRRRECGCSDARAGTRRSTDRA